MGYRSPHLINVVPGLMQTLPSILSFSGIAALDQFAAQIDALNDSSARPNPYQSSRYLRCFAQYNEYFPDSDAIQLYTAWDGERLIGCLPLRRVKDRFGPLCASRICFLAPFDSDQPGLLCTPENEERVAHAIVQHILNHEPRLGMLEIMGQRPGSSLYNAMHASSSARFRARDIEVDPFNEIPIAGASLESYFRSLSSSWRSSVARSTRKLLSAGKTEVVFAEGAQATSAWFDAYLDLESRSWKRNTSAAIVRDTRRIELHRQLLAGHAGFTPSFVGILSDGVLIAGNLNGSSIGGAPQNRGMWNFDLSYDASYADLSPGVLLLLLTVHAAIRREEKFVNLLHSFSHYKHHWKAEMIDVKNVQLIRRWSLHNLRGVAGDLMRSLRRRMTPKPGAAQNKGGSNSARQEAATRPDRSQAMAVTTQALAYRGPDIQLLEHPQICALLPFETRATK
jgi:CelD/BcsL family acetyltransferase involved in cellulose biosynthesis